MCYSKFVMNKNKSEQELRSKTFTQVEALQVVLNCKNYTATSKFIGENLKYGDGRSLACLIPLIKGNPPILKRLGKLNARSGYILAFNPEFMNPIEAKKIVDEIVEQVVATGLMK
ncbi:hypothetical protein A3H26_03925 [candidate division WWE3 bacterium RIFCSPLOWO2_12_FULL_36_10]|uniref:Uncharacterized protein n=1 Tax=candidate division WWE3 bacterium RIFCSPLOWO2_12_FULL_36_10 TaxID=1802630 RepID=A0A1F4VLD3_UNCKA|nr:MAG: hypothetical protein A3H26_03925 [candidate division WWE3 bacterium RIFCSPLOWO2_12_FULL_36_10]